MTNEQGSTGAIARDYIAKLEAKVEELERVNKELNEQVYKLFEEVDALEDENNWEDNI